MISGVWGLRVGSPRPPNPTRLTATLCFAHDRAMFSTTVGEK